MKPKSLVWWYALQRLVCGVALLVLSPLLGLIALAVKIDSRGPVFFAHERVGRFRRPIRVHKFRTMRAGGGGPSITVGGDDRITSVGRFLRATKLDELPQLFNVVKGDMMIVGPRPEAPEYVELWSEQQREIILSSYPGITDPVTISLRREEEALAAVDDPSEYYRDVLLPEKAEGYCDYVKHQSARSDVAIVGRTMHAIVRR